MILCWWSIVIPTSVVLMMILVPHEVTKLLIVTITLQPGMQAQQIVHMKVVKPIKLKLVSNQLSQLQTKTALFLICGVIAILCIALDCM